MSHTATCRCEVCEAVAQGVPQPVAMARAQLDMETLIDQHGWAAHLIVDTYPSSIHTHGLADRFHHPDFQVVLPVDRSLLYSLIAPMARAVVGGRIFRAGDEVPDLYLCPVRLVERIESGRQVLRILFVDPAGRWPDDPRVAPGWETQLSEPK